MGKSYPQPLDTYSRRMSGDAVQFAPGVVVWAAASGTARTPVPAAAPTMKAAAVESEVKRAAPTANRPPSDPRGR